MRHTAGDAGGHFDSGHAERGQVGGEATLERARASKQPSAIAAAEQLVREMEEFRRTHTLTV